jgi:outer membrane receptor for ferrienterochelin and colicins
MSLDKTVTASVSAEQDAHVEQRRQALLERWNSPIAKVIVTRDDIAQFRDRRASDILRRVPGVSMGSPIGGRGRSARLRGIGTQYTQILVNGERIAGGGERRQFELDRIPADMVERIEIIKNPSAEYSSDAVAGIVNIVLRQARDPSVQEWLEKLRRGRESRYSDAP